MAIDPAFAVRVSRLLAGLTDPRDLDIIFNYLRFRCNGFELIRELGNFVAHGDQRNKGTTFQFVDNLVKAVELQTAREHARKNFLPIPGNKQAIQEISLNAFELDPPDSVMKKTGVRKELARRRLRGAFNCIREISGDNIELRKPMSRGEQEVLRHYHCAVTVREVFNVDELLRQLGLCLERLGYVSAVQKQALVAAKPYLAAYTIEKLHRSKIVLAGGIAELHLYKDPEKDSSVAISAMIPAFLAGLNVNVKVVIFSTNYAPEEICDAELAALIKSNSVLNEPIEIGIAGRLQMLR